VTRRTFPGPGWTRLGSAGLDARALLVSRRDIAFWKHLFESYEGVAILRTVETLDEEHAIIDAARDWIEERSATAPGLARYLAAWGDWQSPWG